MSVGRSISHLQALVKWLAVASMVLDHVGAIILPEVLWLRVVGRVAFPAFVGLIAYNVAARGVPVVRYLRPVALFAALSQVPFMLAGFDGLNVFVTFLIGLVVWGVRTGELPVWSLVSLVGAPFVDYGVFGVLLVVAAAEYAKRGTVALGVVTLALVAVAQGSIVWGMLAVGAIAMAYLGVGIAIVALGRVPAIARGHRMLFYWFYPAHLAVLGGVAFLV